MKNKNIFILTAVASLCLPAAAQNDSVYVKFLDQPIETGTEVEMSRANSTASVAVVPGRVLNERSAKNVNNALLGVGEGLIGLQGSGNYFVNNPTFYVRGLQTLTDNTPLFIIDGVEREISMVDPDEVEEVQILKDAAATALFGYRGANGVVYIKTKRGQYNTKTIRFTYEHIFSNLTDKPKFVNAPTYASAMNEALANEGQGPRYTANELAAFQNGNFPFQYPNVDWVEETFRNRASQNRAALEFSGGGQRFRYFTHASVLADDGFIKNANENKGYSTQDKYVRGNVRTNLDIDLTPSTMFRTNVFASLSEMSCPGANVNLWNMVYNLPSAAFPIKNEDGNWGGAATWAGTNNPIAQSTGAAYYKLHERALYFDGYIDQDLSMVIPGLSFNIGASYDVFSVLYEDHSKEYLYGYYPVTGWENGAPTLGTYWEGGKIGEMGTGANTNSYQRRLTFNTSFDYNRKFENHGIYAQIRYDYDFEDHTGVNNKIYRRNYSFSGQYNYKERFYLGTTLMESGSSRLAPGTKWHFSPTVSAGIVLVNRPESSLQYLKVRGSWGILNSDILPGDNNWTYYTQSYTTSGVGYPFGSGYDTNDGQTTIGQMAAVNPTVEKARKIDVGIDATISNALTLQVDYFNNHRYDIWVEGSGAYSALIGFTAPYTNAGIVDQKGIDLTVDYTKSFGDLTVNLGGSFLWNTSKIKNQGEEPKLYPNLVQTGNSLTAGYGLIAEGLFTSQAEIDASPVQTFSTVYPGDIKYKDVNGDGKIDANDVTKLGNGFNCPEIYYTFHLGAEYKNFGFDVRFQGTGNYKAMLSTSGYYWGLINNTSLSQEVYDGRWSQDNNNANAIYPRLSSSSNSNNYRASTYWMRDRSYLKLRNLEVYFNMPQSILAKTGFIKGARIYVRGIDLLCLDHIDNKDAEVLGATTPATRNIAIGARLTF